MSYSFTEQKVSRSQTVVISTVNSPKARHTESVTASDFSKNTKHKLPVI